MASVAITAAPRARRHQERQQHDAGPGGAAHHDAPAGRGGGEALFAELVAAALSSRRNGTVAIKLVPITIAAPRPVSSV